MGLIVSVGQILKMLNPKKAHQETFMNLNHL